MKQIKKSYLAISLFAFASSAFAAQELTPEKADSLQSFKEISIRGMYYSDSDSVRAMSKAADKEGAAYFYITSTNVKPGNDSLRVIYAKLYKADAKEKDGANPNYRQFAGVYEYPKTTALKLEPFDIVRLRGYFPTQNQLNTAVAKAAAAKDAYAYYIDILNQETNANVRVTAYLFKKDAAERKIQPENAIPYDSEAGQLALAKGGEAAMQVERPGYFSSTEFNEQFYSKKFNNKIVDVGTPEPEETNTKTTQANVAVANKNEESSPKTKSIFPEQRSSRYSVTLPDGKVIQELNDATAMKMVPFDSIKFRGYYVNERDISYNAAKRAAEKGAKFYHISRISQNSKGPNVTIYIDLYR